jgi:predicted glutamine amidotransferase
MCRWISYSGDPIPLEELLIKPKISLIDQSMSSRMSAKPTNGDGFGVGWYNQQGEPGIYRSVHPAWNDQNLNELAHHIHSSLFLAHVRRSTGTPVQQTNCHPYRYKNWLFVHNGLLREFQKIKRDLVLEIDPSLYPKISGSTDSELMFFLALTLGLETEPLSSLERMVGLVEKIAKGYDIQHPVQMTLGLSDGSQLLAVRYSSEGQSRSLYHSNSIAALRELYPENERLKVFPDNARGIVSEPLTDEFSEAWVEIPESTAVIAVEGKLELLPFKPKTP